ncbi:MAG: hypothetical protein M3Q49_09935, partial [Actinomycetota bacterium]|nr:hypothetical protein [Actinomycetota bacterium]
AVPAAPSAKEEPEEAGSAAVYEHVVGEGESLSSIAEAYYGDARLWLRIWDHEGNRDVVLEVGDPSLVYPDLVLEVPAATDGEESGAGGGA